MIRRLVVVVVIDETVIAHAGRLRHPVLDVISAFSENDAVKTDRRAEEKRNPEKGALWGKRGEASCAVRGDVDYFSFHEAPKLYADRRMIVYANQRGSVRQRIEPPEVLHEIVHPPARRRVADAVCATAGLSERDVRLDVHAVR